MRLLSASMGGLRNECLSETFFLLLRDARYELNRWREDYNQVRPHSAVGTLSPAEFVKQPAQKKLAARAKLTSESVQKIG